MSENIEKLAHELDITRRQAFLAPIFHRLLDPHLDPAERDLLIYDQEAELTATGLYLTSSLVYAYAPLFAEVENLDISLEEAFQASADELIASAIARVEYRLRGQGQDLFVEDLKTVGNMVRTIVASGSQDVLPQVVDHVQLQHPAHERFGDAAQTRAYFDSQLLVVQTLYRALTKDLDFCMAFERLLGEYPWRSK